MNKVLLALGIAAVAIPLYDEGALFVNETSPNVSLPFIWKGAPAEYVSELWLAIIGALLIIVAAFVNLG